MSTRIGRPVITLDLTHASDATTASAGQALNGLLLQAIITTPDTVDSSATATVSILDSDGNTVYTKDSLEADTTTMDVPATAVPLSGTQTVQVVFSDAQTTTDTSTKVVLLIDRG